MCPHHTAHVKSHLTLNPLVGTTSESGRLLIWAKRPKAAGDSRVCAAVPYMDIFINIASVLGHIESYRSYFQYGGLLYTLKWCVRFLEQNFEVLCL